MESTPPQADPAAKSLAQWRGEIRDAMSSGELLEAYDLADRAVLDFPDDPLLKYQAVLALARAGATRQARAHYDKFGSLGLLGPSLRSKLTYSHSTPASQRTRRSRLRLPSAARCSARPLRATKRFSGAPATPTRASMLQRCRC